ncbi:hypothetical protein [Pseudoalteromonas sp. JC3]|uniref:hypothetical protein n=1 Tax=Pseudoalteromonas sp. JC3 TaxID=2810196 RepID=UPI0019D2A9B9|nr:hypothetical protein [Pseudoalteromonas sp. JC3]MBR8845013.1 hypothetical protein [Pseudoalteromonas sp. JC3]WJE11074.1 hypothetical protein QSH61_23610 [Pseudoalteromonas sp. JC3]
MGAHIFNTELNDEQAPCTLELQLQGLNGKDCTVPLGFAEVQRASSPKPDDQIPFVETVELRVFSEVSLDINKAKAPEYVPMFKDQKEFQEDEPVGYYYFFVNGYLWREIAAISGGMLSEVDLREYHGQSFRPNNGTHMPRLTLPIRAKGLFSDATSVETMTYQVAFSRVQWSWDYISALGDMKPDDSRFDKKPMTSKCPDEGKASTYRSERMQTIDFSSAPNWDSIENLKANEDGEPCIYLHDVLGIVQNLKLEGDVLYLAFVQHQNHLASQDFYDSALLASTMFANPELFESKMETYQVRGFDGPETRHNLVYTKNDKQSEATRKIGESLSLEKLQKHLVHTPKELPNLITKIKQFLRFREELLHFFEGKYGEQKEINLADTCRNNQIAPPTSFTAAYWDLSLLSPLAYRNAFECAYGHLNSLNISEKTFPIYFPALVDHQVRKFIAEKLKKIHEGYKDFTSELHADDNSWLCIQFTPQEDLYGEDLKSENYIVDNIRSEFGAYNPEKLTQAAFEKDIDKNEYPFLFLELRFLQVVEKGLSENLIYWQQSFANRTLADANQYIGFYHKVGAIAKSASLSTFSDIELHDFNNVPANRVVITAPLTKHPLFEAFKIQQRDIDKAKKQERTVIPEAGEQHAKSEHALTKALAARKAGKPIHGNHIATIATRLRNELEGYKTFKTLPASVVRAEIENMLDEVIDIEGTFKDHTSVGGKVLTRLASNFSREEIYEENIIRAERGLKTINYTPRQVTEFEGKRFASIPLALLTGITVIKTYMDYEKEFAEEKGGIDYQGAKHFSLVVGGLVAVGTVLENYDKSKFTQAITKNYANTSDINVKITALRIVGAAAGVAAAYVQFCDSIKLYEKRDIDAAVAGVMSAGLGLASALWGAYFVAMGPIGWMLFIGSIVFAILSAMWTDSEIERWCKRGIFSSANVKLEELQKSKDKEEKAFSNPQKYLLHIMKIILKPVVEINKVGVGKYIVEVYPSDFISGTSELELSMSFLSGLGGDPYNRLRQGDLKKVTGLDNYKSTYDKNNKMTKASYFISVDESYINKVRFALSFRFNNEITTKGEYDA